MTPETPTPRTDAAEILWNDTGLFVVPADLARQLERENQTFRAAQKACEDCDAPRVDRIAELERELAAKDAHADEIYKAAVNLAAKLEADLATERELADRLGRWMEDHRKNWQWHKVDESCGCEDCVFLVPFDEALAAWREARK